MELLRIVLLVIIWGWNLEPQQHSILFFYCKRRAAPLVPMLNIRAIVFQWMHSLAVRRNSKGIIVKEEVQWYLVVLDLCQKVKSTCQVSHPWETNLLQAPNKLKDLGLECLKELILSWIKRSHQWLCVNLPMALMGWTIQD